MIILLNGSVKQNRRLNYAAIIREGGKHPKLQAISYSITREKAPIYTMGSADVRAYSRNKRGIAGSLIWINFDRHALRASPKRGRLSSPKPTRAVPRSRRWDPPEASAIFFSLIVCSVGVSVADTIDKLDSQVNDIYGMNQLAEPWYSDQILPFDITLAGANE